jgi:hypothetical protein
MDDTTLQVTASSSPSDGLVLAVEGTADRLSPERPALRRKQNKDASASISARSVSSTARGRDS